MWVPKCQNKRWYKITTPSWSYGTPGKLPFLYIERRTGQYFYHNHNSDADAHKIVPSLLANQLIIPLTDQELQAKQKGTSHSFHPSSFIPQMQPTPLQDQTLAVCDSHEVVTNGSYPSEMDITVLKRKISQLKVKYKQSDNILEEQ